MDGECAPDKDRDETAEADSTKKDEASSGNGSGTGPSNEENSSSHKGSESSIVCKGESEVSAKNTMDSAYGSHGTSVTYKRSTTGSSHSKSSGSGSSGFGCFKTEPPTTSNALVTNKTSQYGAPATSTATPQPVLPSFASSSHKKKEKTAQRKSKSKSIKDITAAVPTGSSCTSMTESSTLVSAGKMGDTVPKQSSGQQIAAQEDKAAKVAALSQALVCIDKFKKIQEEKEDNRCGPNASEINDLATNLQEASQGAASGPGKTFPFVTAKEQITDVLNKEQVSKGGDGFCAAVSLNDGRVMCTTASISSTLGYPKDMWIARSFIDFVHPKDRLTFTNQITRGVTLPFGENLKGPTMDPSKSKINTENNDFYCRLRMYQGLKQGKYSVKQRKTVYIPFCLGVRFKEIEMPSAPEKPKTEPPFATVGSDEDNVEKSGNGGEGTSTTTSSSEMVGRCGLQSVCLVITAMPIRSAYTVPNQEGPFKGGTFVTRHLASCTYSMVEEAAIPFLGYLPQDMERSDVFSYYHPQDLPYLKQVYETIMLEQGKPFRSRSYRFKIKNGGYILLETDWSCFINPWSKKLEFVIGKHTVLKGPPKPDVFCADEDEEETSPDDEALRSESKATQEEIRLMLTETIRRPVASGNLLLGQNSTRRRQELATYMGSLLEEIAKGETAQSESTSVLGTLGTAKGNISPHHDLLSSDSPPSYNQLNYNDNLARFFNSQPKTLTAKEAATAMTEDINMESAAIADDNSKSNSNPMDSCSGSRIKTTSNPCDGENSNTASNSESLNSRSRQLIKKKTEVPPKKEKWQSQDGNNAAAEESAGKKNNQESGSGGDSEGNGGGTGTVGTSGGVSAVHNTGYKRLHPHNHRHSNRGQGGNGDGNASGSAGDGCSGSGGSGRIMSGGNGSGTSTYYKAPILTEELLHVHNRGMEQKMIEHYKDTKKGELVFIKNKNKSPAAKAHHLKRGADYHLGHYWSSPRQERTSKGHQNRVQTDGAVAGRSGANPNVGLWSGVVRTQAGGHELIFPSQSYEQPKRMHSQPTSLHHQSQQHRIPIPAPHVMSVAPPVTPQREGHQSGPPSRVSSIDHPPGTPVYTNLIPAYYIPHDGSSLASGAGAFLMSPLGAGVQGNSFLHQSPVQYIQSAPPSAVILQPMGPAHQLAPQTMTPSTSGMVVQPPDASRPDPGALNRAGRSASVTARGTSPELPHSVSVDSCISGNLIDPRESSDKMSAKNQRNQAKQTFKFQQPSTARGVISPGSRATSVKAEPGSALESNIESNASVSASVMDKMLSPGILLKTSRQARLAASSREAVEQLMSDGSTSSSLYSLLKSSDDYGPTGDSSNTTSDEENKDQALAAVVNLPAKPTLKDPPWLENIDITPQLVYNYQINSKPIEEVLRRDFEKLKKMYQPKRVNEQLSQLLKECEERGVLPRPLLDEDTSSSSLSSGEGTSTSNDTTSDMDADCRQERFRRKVKKQVSIDLCSFIYEADAPLPPTSHSPKPVVKSKRGETSRNKSYTSERSSSMLTSTQSRSEDESSRAHGGASSVGGASSKPSSYESEKIASKILDSGSNDSKRGSQPASIDEGIGSKEHSDSVNKSDEDKTEKSGIDSTNSSSPR